MPRTDSNDYSTTSERRRLLSMRLRSSAAWYSFAKSAGGRNTWLRRMCACEITSKREPVAISTNRAKSVRELPEVPSAMLEEMDTAARLIWLVRPNRSSLGKPVVREYTRSANAIAFCQTSSFSKLNMGDAFNAQGAGDGTLRLSTLNKQLSTHSVPKYAAITFGSF